ncbi:hypothetical protein LAU_0417 [Lausannevirus]|uniref:Uncharacterized protein n=1 Tax=Lausannevirus TaxID=999883 RepID=F2WLZ4_9VIRU|nr:hypothetical protein LAU_0417 [Lausannevirus]AEA07267.1 hypothetical protein LAU_0417 [Lausannevirus]
MLRFSHSKYFIRKILVRCLCVNRECSPLQKLRTATIGTRPQHQDTPCWASFLMGGTTVPSFCTHIVPRPLPQTCKATRVLKEFTNRMLLILLHRQPARSVSYISQECPMVGLVVVARLIYPIQKNQPNVHFGRNTTFMRKMNQEKISKYIFRNKRTFVDPFKKTFTCRLKKAFKIFCVNCLCTRTARRTHRAPFQLPSFCCRQNKASMTSLPAGRKYAV